MTGAMPGKNRYPNISAVLLALAVIVFTVKTVATPRSGISLYGDLPLWARLIPGIFALLGAAAWFLPSFGKIKKYVKPTLVILLATQIAEHVVFPVVDTYLSVRDLTRIPEQGKFLDSMVYIASRYWPDFLRGLSVTLRLSFAGTVAGLLLAIIFVFFRTLPVGERDGEIAVFLKRSGNFLVKTYVNVFRGTPMMVQAVIIYYLLPVALAALFKVPQAEVDKIFTLMTAGFVVVTLNTAAYLTEVLRGGIEAVDKGQLEAARSLGMSYWQAMRLVIFPQGIKNALPAICNEFLINIKDTSVLNVIGVAELFFVAQDAKYQYYRTYEPFIIAAVIYLVVTLSTSRLIMAIEKRMNLEVKELPSSN